MTGTTSRRLLLKGGLAAGAGSVLSPVLWQQPGSAAQPPGGIHLAYGADPTSEMTLAWSTPASVKRPAIEFGPTRHLGHTLRAHSTDSQDITTVYHHADLTELHPGTTYHYRLTHRGATVRSGTFTTAPQQSKPFRFAAFGDMGVSADGAACSKLIASQKPAFAFMVGDLCYAGGGSGTDTPGTMNFKLWDQWLAQIQTSAHAVPWMTTVGNHEMENGNGALGYNGYLDRMRMPHNGAKGAEVTYSFVHGNVGFIALDGNDASAEYDRNRGYASAAMDAWLVSTLTAMRADKAIDFIVVGFHNCMYCKNFAHGSDGGCRDRWGSIFDTYSVDLVVNGHNHTYERTHPTKNGLPTAMAPSGATVDSGAGTTYLTAGGSGAGLYQNETFPLVAEVKTIGGLPEIDAATWSSVTYDQQHTVAFLDVTPRDKGGTATMRLRALTASGAVIDTVTLQRTTTA